MNAVRRLILWLTPFDVEVPSTTIELVSMLKAVMVEAASTKTFAIWVLLGADADGNSRLMKLMIDPLLNKITTKLRNEGNSCW